MRRCLGLVLLLSAWSVPGSRQPRHEVYFPITEDGGEPPGQIRLVLPIERRDEELTSDVVYYQAGSSRRIGFHWNAEYPGTYEASIPAHANQDGDFELVVVAPHDPALRVVRLGRRDTETIEALTATDVASVEVARAYGLDLDGDGRADLAFAKVCGWTHPDGMCEGHYQAVLQRRGETWLTAPTCALGVLAYDEPCFTY